MPHHHACVERAGGREKRRGDRGDVVQTERDRCAERDALGAVAERERFDAADRVALRRRLFAGFRSGNGGGPAGLRESRLAMLGHFCTLTSGTSRWQFSPSIVLVRMPVCVWAGGSDLDVRQVLRDSDDSGIHGHEAREERNRRTPREGEAERLPRIRAMRGSSAGAPSGSESGDGRWARLVAGGQGGWRPRGWKEGRASLVA